MPAAFAIQRLTCYTVVALLSAGSSATAQIANPPARTQTPPRDTSNRIATGTSIIRGHVVAADGQRPLRRVQIKATAPELANGARTTSSDESGEYELTDLPAGRYTISASRGGFLTLTYGQRRPRELGRVVDLGAGATAGGVDFALSRMSIISGRLTDEDGNPIAGVNVMAMRSIYVAGHRQLVPSGDARAMTDDAGDFRIGDLVPGTYIVSATTREKWSVSSGGGQATMGYAPTYFPGTTNVSDAMRLVVGLGEERSATDFALIPGRTATISGTALDAQGQPFRSVNLSVEVRAEAGGSFSSASEAPVGADGAFLLRDVAPGAYVLRASRQTSDPEIARLPIVIDGTDLTNLLLTGSGGGTVSGRARLADGVTAAMPAIQLSIEERVIGQPDPAMLGTFRGRYVPVAPSRADGSFAIAHVFGPAFLKVTAPDGWIASGILKDGHDLSDTAIELRNGEQLDDLQVVLTNRLTSLTGTLTDAGGSPLPDGTIVLFAADRLKWFEGSRFVRAVRPDQRGRFEAKGLPPGEYLAVALEYVEEGAWNEPEYLDSIQRYGEKVSLAAEKPSTTDLKLVTVP